MLKKYEPPVDGKKCRNCNGTVEKREGIRKWIQADSEAAACSRDSFYRPIDVRSLIGLTWNESPRVGRLRRLADGRTDGRAGGRVSDRLAAGRWLTLHRLFVKINARPAGLVKISRMA